MAALTLYSRKACHLCHEMQAELEDLCRGESVTIEIVDVDDDPALAARYGTRIPVLVAEGEELCVARLDRARLSEYLRHCR